MHVTDQRVAKQTEAWTMFKIKSLGNKKHLQLQIAKANPMSEQKLQKKKENERERERERGNDVLFHEKTSYEHQRKYKLTVHYTNKF